MSRTRGRRDRRQWKRYRLAVPLGFANGTGMSRDISGTGISFETDQAFTPGAPIDFTMTFAHAFAEGPTQLCCHGTVVRVDRRLGKSRVAALITDLYLSRPHHPSVAARRAAVPRRTARRRPGRASATRARPIGP